MAQIKVDTVTDTAGTAGPSFTYGAKKHQVRLHTSNGYGSTNTCIRRFTTAVENVGTAITYADSATLGATFTINEAGVYAITYTENFNGAAIAGLSLNSSQLTTSIATITTADRLVDLTTGGADYSGQVSWVGYLAAGSVIRPHTNAGVASTTTRINFTICKVL